MALRLKSLSQIVRTSLVRQNVRSLSTLPHDPENPHGTLRLSYTNEMLFQNNTQELPCYRVMDEEGEIMQDSHDPKVNAELCKKMYRTMVTLRTMDGIFYDAQRQGRMSFYMTNTGEEASHVGSAAALVGEDMIFGQYREAGVLMWRGFSLRQFAHQCWSTEADLGKGRQMPVHYGSNDLNFQTISSPLATQIPQATGAAYAFKLAGKPNCVICYFGEGAASEGDFHAALNFACTLETPTIFFCRNNAYAISTPADEQYRGDGIGARGLAYGMETIRVDGNDIWAVYNATAEARKIAVTQSKPVLIEAVSYRAGHHSTSDDATRYRTDDELRAWKKGRDPIARMRAYMEKRGMWSEEEDDAHREKTRKEVLAAMNEAERAPKPHVDEMFTDVYDSIPPNLLEQREKMYEHVRKYSNEYPSNHAK